MRAGTLTASYLRCKMPVAASSPGVRTSSSSGCRKSIESAVCGNGSSWTIASWYATARPSRRSTIAT
jgi:hypothetical protein